MNEEITGAFCQLSGDRKSHKQLIDNGALVLLVSSARLSNSTIRMDCAQVSSGVNSDFPRAHAVACPLFAF